MENGKLPENILKRSVLKNITAKNENLISGAGVGKDSSAVQIGNEKCVVSGSSYAALFPGMENMAVYGAINNLAVSQADPVSMWMNLLLPENTPETRLKEIMRNTDTLCNRLGISLMGGHTQVSRSVNDIIVGMTGIGHMRTHTFTEVKPGMDIVVTKWIGLSGTWMAIKCASDKLTEHLPQHFLEQTETFDGWFSVDAEARIAGLHKVACMHDASNGGIFGALWELGEQAQTGFEVELRKIPVRQETIEICEQLRVNPYQLNSMGCVVLISEEGHNIVRALSDAGIPAQVVGRTMPGRDRVLLNEDEKRYLELPKPDEIYTFL